MLFATLRAHAQSVETQALKLQKATYSFQLDLSTCNLIQHGNSITQGCLVHTKNLNYNQTVTVINQPVLEESWFYFDQCKIKIDSIWPTGKRALIKFYYGGDGAADLTVQEAKNCLNSFPKEISLSISRIEAVK